MSSTMAMELLNCIICPKQPCFSDVSHLLTHVSSKGHLSHLHKLQVRSHQESEAGLCLVSYNQWYQQHGIADLLSERMQQKEAKKANKRAGIQRRAVSTEEGRRVAQPVFNPNSFLGPWGTLGQSNITTQQSFQAVLRSRRRVMQEEMNDPDYMPALPLEYDLPSIRPSQLSNPVGPTEYPDLLNDGFVNVSDDVPPKTPECSKLKGTIWPGMTMFDAATEELQKKRNQKKDGSVLQNMQANSTLIEPMESTYSPGGTMRRKRHMNELECDDDLIEGETPIKKPSVTRKRKSPKRPNKKAPRRYTRRSKTHKKTKSTESISTSTSRRTASTSPEFKQPYARSRAESLRDDHITLESMDPVCKPKKPKSQFRVFTDEIPPLPPAVSLEALPNPFLDASQYFRQPMASGLSLPPAPWSQPQDYDPFKDYRLLHTCNTQLHDVSSGKENANPLSWKHESMTAQHTSPMHALDGSIDEFDAEFGSLGQVYAYTKNPLADDFFFHGRTEDTLPPLR